MLDNLRKELNQLAVPAHERQVKFFKTGPGDYAEHDQFLGVPTPQLRKLAKIYQTISLEQIINLLQSPINDERLLALLMLVSRYQKGAAASREAIYQLYKTHIKQVNNWNLVDASAHLILGAHLHQRKKDYLLDLAQSRILWERRIAIVSTWYFIRQNEFTWTIKINALLINDSHDLIHKAVGWMLREMGKRNKECLITFLENYAHQMPRTMLRYAIEKLDIEQKRIYLAR
jgi:3-methyladenine DNA glycosylase AlkD